MSNEKENLRAVLYEAAQHCLYYQTLDLIGAPLIQFPIIDRAILRNSYPAFINSRLCSSVRAAAIIKALTGAAATKASEFVFDADIMMEQTSGSSGVPLRLAKTHVERSKLGLTAWRMRKQLDPKVEPSNFLALFHRFLDTPVSVNPFDSSASGIMAFYKWLSDNKYRWIHAPSALIAYHAAVLESLGHLRPSIHLRHIELAGSCPSPDQVDLVKRVFSAEVLNHYGTRETWTVGLSRQPEPLSINLDAVHIELLDENKCPIIEVGVEGDVVVTSKVLYLIPFVRYKTGDRGQWHLDSPDKNARPIKRLALSSERNINMVQFGGKWVSGNILFKDLLHKIDHQIGYGYSEFLQIRKVGAYDWQLLLDNSGNRAMAVLRKLEYFFSNYDQRICLKLKIVSADESRHILNNKPYLFVNQHDAPL